MEALHAAGAGAGLLSGWIEADPTLVGVAVAVLAVAAVLYVFVYAPAIRDRRSPRHGKR